MSQETLRVLSIEDCAGDARLIREALAEASGLGWGLPPFELSQANTLAGGLACLDAGGIDVILTDLDLFDSQASDTFVRLRAHAPQVPIVVLTGRENEELARMTLRAGAQDYLFKREMSGSLLAHALVYAVERQRVKEELDRAHSDLERLVAERTAELQQANERLRREIADRRQIEDALRESEENLHRAQQLAHIGSWQVDLNTGQVVASKTSHAIYGLHEHALTLDDIQKIPLPEHRPALDKALRELIEEGKPYDVEFRICRPIDGALRDVHSTAEYDRARNVVLGTLQDVTERRQAEAALRESEEKYRSLFDQLMSGIQLHDLTGQILDVNQMACVQSGYSREELLQRTIFDLHAEQPGTLNPMRDEILHDWEAWQPGQRFIVEAEHQRKDGTIMPVEVSTGLIRYGDKELMLAIVQDITERKQAEAEREKLQMQLAQAQKMEAIGRLAGGVAHDFNNMLGVIIGHSELAWQYIDASDPLYADLTEIHQAAQRSADLTRQLLAFARQQIIAPKVMDLNDTVKNMLKMLSRLIGEDIELIWVPGAGLWSVKIDPGQLNQILINLCLNARDAIARADRLGGGTITIETQNVVRDELYSAGKTWFLPGEYVQLSVTDDGCGMNEEVLANLFEPYFTTKPEGQSGGLGLATVYGAVKQNNGFVHVYSEPDEGATFRIYLPRSEGAVIVAQANDLTVRGGHETILVVEDEPAILRLAQTVLGRMGYTVLAASQPGDALLRAAEHDGAIDLLVTDVVMPGMNGRELAAQVEAGHPGLRCLFMSGYTANVIAHRGVLEEGVWFLQKPFSVDELALKVREVLDARAALPS